MPIIVNMRQVYKYFLLSLLIIAFDANALPRSKAAVAEFKRANPCPSTQMRRGSCPGYQVDHRIPLKCGGPDRPDNMQWLSVDDHKAKTKREARLCRKRR